ncbi:MAG: Superoxide dismutase, partial [Bacilli bacterium]|nr:Superoxide dismutase [Bacilli bacterium]
SMMEWCSKGSEYLSFLRTSQEMMEGQKHDLDHWQYALQELEARTRNVLGSCNSAFYYPAVINQLLQEGRLLQNGFTRFIQAEPFKKEDIAHSKQMIGVSPENHNVYAQSSLKNVRLEQESIDPVPIGGHTLPPLPYDYNMLEPYIDEKTMRLHHDKHHKSYVDGLNKAEKMMEKARKTGDFELITHWEREAAFHGAGHYLHTIFWYNMIPHGGGEPTGGLQSQIKKDFGSFSDFKKHFSAAAEKAEAVGWAILVWAPRSQRLEILQAEKHQNLSQWDVIPLLVLDVWEHAYYLKYQNDRKSYIEAWWNVVNWDNVRERYEKARTLTWKPH